MPAKIYNFSGYGQNCSTLSTVSCFDRNWTTFPSQMPTGRINFGGAVIGSKVYLCGGYAVVRLSCMEMFDTKTGQWSILSSLPEVRNECSAASVGDHSIYVCGGGDPDNEISKSVFRYDVQTDHWSVMSDMLEPRSSHQLVSLADHLYAIGGYMKTTVEQYDPGTNQWRYVSSTKFDHYCFGSAVLNNRIYVCSHEGFEEYSPESDSWRTLPSLSNRFIGRSLVAFNGSLLSIGGSEDGEQPSKSVFSFDVCAEKWIQLDDLDVCRKNHFSAVVDSL